MRGTVIVLAALSLSGCVTARMHSEAELNSIGERCGLALGELFQDEEEKKLVFVFRPDSTPAQRNCVAKWAKRNGLRTVVVESLELPQS